MRTIYARSRGWTAAYCGGPYIELRLGGHTVEVINVHDYVAGESTIKPTQKDVANELRAWLEENKGNLNTYYEHVRSL